MQSYDNIHATGTYLSGQEKSYELTTNTDYLTPNGPVRLAIQA